LRSEELDILEKVYELPSEDNDRVNYKELVEEVDTVFTLKELEKDPLIRPVEFKIPDFLDPEKRLTNEENDVLHNTMIRLAILMNKYRVMPKVFFKDAVSLL
jgi:hypothetical protein